MINRVRVNKRGDRMKIKRSFGVAITLAALLVVLGTLQIGTPVASAQANAPATGAPVINGTVQASETLEVDTSGIADGDGMVNATFAYQWISNDGSTDTDITGETNSTYVIKPWDLGKRIKVRVSFTDDAGNEETLTSLATMAVESSPNIKATGSPGINGMAEVGQSLSVVRWGSIINIQDENGMRYATLSFQWIRNDGTDDTDIPDATGSSYTLADADQGETVKVRVSFTDDGANPEEVTSRATTEVAARPNSSDLGAPTALVTRYSVPGEDKGIVLEWWAPEGTVTGYQVLRVEGPTNSRFWEALPHGCVPLMVVHVNDTGSDATTYTDTDVAEGAKYYYRVRAVNSDGVGRVTNSSGRQYKPHGWWPSGAQTLRGHRTIWPAEG